MSYRLFSAKDLKMHPSSAADAFEAFSKDVFPLIVSNFRAEDGDVAQLIELLRKKESTQRSCVPAHLTTSSVILDPLSEDFLMLFHKKIGEWVYPGGHADGSWELLHSSLRECFEETSLPSVEVIPPRVHIGSPMAELCPHFFQKYVIRSSLGELQHIHFDAVFLFRATSRSAQHDPLESSGLKWFSRRELMEHCQRPDGVVVAGVDSLTARVCLRAMQSALGSG